MNAIVKLILKDLSEFIAKTNEVNGIFNYRQGDLVELGSIDLNFQIDRVFEGIVFE
jgi:hypothetical protein